MEKLMSILKELRPEVDFEKETKLIDGGILDSFDLVSLIGELNESFEIEISFDDMEPENFNSAKQIYQMIVRLQNED
ncbi:MAG: phosphopantetheine-binding protein [Roseburia sp.]|nr:phosphopantetheine-binding protein [Roseburia sp.]MCM1277866.1 phosphopantetheine-binding protein [Robinsoniella sp.]